MPPVTRSFALSLLLSVSSLLIAQQPPTVLHAQFSTQSAEHGLSPEIDRLKQAGGPLWTGYFIPVEEHFQTSNGDGISYLESHYQRTEGKHDYSNSTPTDHAVILLRIAGGNVEKIRVESANRQLDAGGLRFVWLTGVTPADSIRTLKTLAVTGGLLPLREEAVFPISLHHAPETVPALAEIAGPSNDLALREKAAFWLANQHGHDGFAAIQRFTRDDADPKFREKLTFDLTLSHDPAALEELIRMAHTDASPQVRKQAQFWMATSGGKKVAGDLRTSAQSDPDREVRKSAVFALSRLPGDEAAAQLIQVAQSSKDGEVRKQAVFWLGQSNDPRALDYLTQLLTTN
ncbi:HEAT repeat domain-containing protein [Granulicella arctica]|uniref:HEAT repeat domain-containing protein n=1 Tax=Granulicella arctica TaxID=940613 RepID=UPI0021E08961|nr:HEAT repeat domain-containing protein [Granulicella arctica]